MVESLVLEIRQCRFESDRPYQLLKGKTLETIQFFITAFWQEILFGASLLLFITGVTLKMGSFPGKTEKVTKNEWLQWKREGIM